MLQTRSLVIIFFLCWSNQHVQVTGRKHDSSILLESENFDIYADYDNNKGELKNIEPERDSNNLIDIGRSVRCVRSSRRHLREDDANRVAKYFLRGGPLLGHSHFLKEADYDEDNDDELNLSTANSLEDEDDVAPSTNETNLDANEPAPIVSVLYTPTMYSIPEAPIVSKTRGLHLVKPVINTLASFLKPRIPVRHSARSDSSHLTPFSPLLPYVHGLREIPHNLLRATPVLKDLLPPRESAFQSKPATSRKGLRRTGKILNSKRANRNRSLRKSHLARSKTSGKDQSNLRGSNTGIRKTSIRKALDQRLLLNNLEPTAYVARIVPHNEHMPPIIGLLHYPTPHRADDYILNDGATKITTEQEKETYNVNSEEKNTYEEVQTIANDVKIKER